MYIDVEIITPENLNDISKDTIQNLTTPTVDHTGVIQDFVIVTKYQVTSTKLLQVS